MLKLEKSQYLNSILQLNYTKYERKLGSSGAQTRISSSRKNWQGPCQHPISISSPEKTDMGALSGSSEEFLVSLKYGKSICIWRGPDQGIPICNICG